MRQVAGYTKENKNKQNNLSFVEPIKCGFMCECGWEWYPWYLTEVSIHRYGRKGGSSNHPEEFRWDGGGYSESTTVGKEKSEHMRDLRSLITQNLELIECKRSGFPRWLSGKESARQAGDMSSIPGLGRSRRSPGEENGNPLQYSCLENLMDRGAWWATVHGVSKSQTGPRVWAWMPGKWGRGELWERR